MLSNIFGRYFLHGSLTLGYAYTLLNILFVTLGEASFLTVKFGMIALAFFDTRHASFVLVPQYFNIPLVKSKLVFEHLEMLLIPLFLTVFFACSNRPGRCNTVSGYRCADHCAQYKSFHGV